jgi:hypothetical protein
MISVEKDYNILIFRFFRRSAGNEFAEVRVSGERRAPRQRRRRQRRRRPQERKM